MFVSPWGVFVLGLNIETVTIRWGQLKEFAAVSCQTGGKYIAAEETLQWI